MPALAAAEVWISLRHLYSVLSINDGSAILGKGKIP